jgi:hypothetical protein
VRFQPGQRLAFSAGAAQAPVLYYLEQGTVELQWEAALPVALSAVFTTALQRLPAGRATPPPPPEEDAHSYLDSADSLAFNAPQVRNMAPLRSLNRRHAAAEAAAAVARSGGGGSGSGAGPAASPAALARADSLAATLRQATARAEALMANATGGSLDNLLLSQRAAAQYVGALSLLDPHYFADRWRAAAVARSEVRAVRLTREGLDLFLAQNPLAQVHLRASMAKARAEITKLEALERVAEAHRRKRPEAAAAGAAGAARPLAAGGAQGARALEVVAGAVAGAAAAAADGVQQAGATAQTATLDMFALVSRLRAAAGAAIKDSFLPVPASYTRT